MSTMHLTPEVVEVCRLLPVDAGRTSSTSATPKERWMYGVQTISLDYITRFRIRIGNVD